MRQFQVLTSWQVETCCDCGRLICLHDYYWIKPPERPGERPGGRSNALCALCAAEQTECDATPFNYCDNPDCPECLSEVTFDAE